MAGMIITQNGVSKVSGNPGSSYLNTAAQMRLRQQQGNTTPNFNQNLVNSQPQSAGFDANAYVAGMDQRALNNLIGSGPNLAGYGDRLAATQAAQARLNTLNPPQSPGMGMGANGQQAGVSSNLPVNMPGQMNPGANTIAPPSSTVDYGRGSANDLSGPRPPAATFQSAGNGMGANGQQIPLAGSQGMVTSPVTGPATPFTGANPQGIPNQGTPNPAAVSGMAPQSGGFTYKGVGPGGNSVFTDPTTGEIFTMPEQQGYQVGQGYSLPSTQPKTGLIGSEEALESGLGAGIRAVEQGYGQGRQDVAGALQGANSALNPYMQSGRGSSDYQAALSGALGNDAQQTAMDGFMNSPGQQYLLNESERAIRRNASATGGLGGANVQRALQENAVGLAAQDFDNAFNRLGSVSDRGLAASGQVSGNTMNAGQALAGLATGAADLNANMAYGTGQNMAAGRTRAGEMIAGNIQDSTSNLANIMRGTGQDVSGAIGQGTSNLAQLLAGSGKDNYQAQAAYAALLAQMASQAGAQNAGLGGLGGTSQTGGILGGVGNLLSGFGAVGQGGGFGAIF